MRRSPITPVYEQDPLGTRMQFVRAGQEADRGYLSELLIGDQQGNLGSGLSEIGQHGQRIAGRCRANDLIVGLVPPFQVGGKRLEPRRILRYQDEVRSLHESLPQGRKTYSKPFSSDQASNTCWPPRVPPA